MCKVRPGSVELDEKRLHLQVVHVSVAVHQSTVSHTLLHQNLPERDMARPVHVLNNKRYEPVRVGMWLWGRIANQSCFRFRHAIWAIGSAPSKP